MKEIVESEILLIKPGVLMRHGVIRSFAFPRHMHDGYSIGLVEQGVNYFECAGSRFAARVNQLCITNPEQIHTGEADDDGLRYLNLFIEPQAMNLALGKSANAEMLWFKEAVTEDPVAAQRFRSLMAACLDVRDASAEAGAVDTEFLLLLQRMEQIATGLPQKKCSGDSALARVRECLHSIFDRPITLEELAQIAQMNTSHLVRSFTNAFGISPYAYHLNRRLLRAQRMIESGVSVVDAALLTGFTDQSHFTRHFRRIMGITPGRLAKGWLPA